MGDISDYYSRQEECSYPTMSLFTRRIVSYTHWEQKDGTKILLTSMTTSHLKNCILMINRNKWRLDWLEYLKTELELRN
tara:strand:+ start:53 stop:289 length:237 start_codon:yes stop_codon:yes gene_type:complete